MDGEHWGLAIRTIDIEVDSLIRTKKLRITESVRIVINEKEVPVKVLRYPHGYRDAYPNSERMSE